jgi:hypothetical protein
MAFVVGEALHFAILEFLRIGTFGTHFRDFIFGPIRHHLVRISAGNVNRDGVGPSQCYNIEKALETAPKLDWWAKKGVLLLG